MTDNIDLFSHCEITVATVDFGMIVEFSYKMWSKKQTLDLIGQHCDSLLLI